MTIHVTNLEPPYFRKKLANYFLLRVQQVKVVPRTFVLARGECPQHQLWMGNIHRGMGRAFWSTMVIGSFFLFQNVIGQEIKAPANVRAVVEAAITRCVWRWCELRCLDGLPGRAEAKDAGSGERIDHLEGRIFNYEPSRGRACGATRVHVVESGGN